MILGTKYVKPSEVKDGDALVIIDSGRVEESAKFKNPDGTTKKEYRFQVKDGFGEEKTVTMNKASRDNLVRAYGSDTSNWVGKVVTISLVNTMIAGQMKKVLVLEPVVDKPVDSEQ